VNCEILDVVGVANVIVPFVITDVGDKDPTPVVVGMTGGALVIGALPDEEPDPVAVGMAVADSEARVPVRLCAAAQAARDIPCRG
jgi:hypothetical protein